MRVVDTKRYLKHDFLKTKFFTELIRNVDKHIKEYPQKELKTKQVKNFYEVN